MQFKNNKIALLVCGSLSASTFLYANESATLELDSLIISAKAPVNEASFSGSVTVITADEISASGASNLTDVLATTPSVQMVVTGSNPSAAPQLRGFDAEQTLILVNGKRIPNTDRSVPRSPAYRYGLVPLSNIDRIEIIRGPASSLYGADALAGVINIITKKATADWSGSVSFYTEQTDGANGGDGLGMSLNASGAISENLDLLVALESTNSDTILDKDTQKSLTPDKDLKNYQVDLGIDLDNGDRIEFGAISSDEEGIDYSPSTDKEGELTNITNKIFTAEYFTKIKDFDTSIAGTFGKAEVLEKTRVWQVNERSLSMDSQGQLNANNYLTLGINYREEEAERSDSSTFHDEINSTTLLAQDIINISKDSNLTLGVAYDMHSKYGNEASPKVSWLTQISPSVGVKAGYGESYLAPSLSQGSSAYVVNAGPGRVYVGNDDLKPETAETLELGLTFQQKNGSGALTVFRSDVDNLINLSTASAGTSEYSNVNSSALKGLEASWSFFNDSGTQKLNLSYTYLDTKDKSTGNELINRANHLAKLNYFHKSVFAGFDMDAAARYIGDQYTDSENTEMLDAYFVADLGISKEILENTTVRFGINNLTNEVVLSKLNNNDQLLESGRSYKLSLAASF